MSLRGCSNCSETDWRCLDFHHVNPQDKDDSVTQLVVNGNSKKRILKEIEKCIVLCANCHRKITWESKRQGE